MMKDELYKKRWLAFYDAMTPDKVYKTTFNKLARIIKVRVPRAKNILEVGCGTGRYIELFVNKGFNVKGIDVSKDALAKAKKQVPKATFEVADMTKFREPESYDVICCLFEVLRYNQTLSACKKTIANVYASLEPGGLFLCDFSIHKLTKGTRSMTKIRMDNKTVFVHNKFFKNKGYLTTRADSITTIVNGREKWSKKVTRMPLLRITKQKMVTMLKQAGFMEVSAVSKFRNNDRTEHLFIAQKPKLIKKGKSKKSKKKR